MGGATHSHGTRFELFLEDGRDAARAVYRAEVRRPGEDIAEATVEVTRDGARVLSGGETLGDASRDQLVALAKTVGRRGDDEAPWPRRVQRWRQPGVR